MQKVISDYGRSEQADMHLADTLSKTSIFVMVFAWIALPDYRKYLTDPIKTRMHNIFIFPWKLILYVIEDKPG